MPSTTLNGVDLRSLGFLINGRPRFRSWSRAVNSVPLVGSLGTILTGFGDGQSRPLILAGNLMRDTYALRAALEDTVKDLAASGVVSVVDDDGVSVRVAQGTGASVEFDEYAPGRRSRATRCSIAVTCPDPTFRALEPTIRHLVAAATRYDLALGNAPSNSIIEIMGSAVNPVVTYRDAGGTAIWTLTFGATTLASTESLVIDCTLGTITKYASGVATDAIALLTAGQSYFPRPFDPQDGSVAVAFWPTIEVSTGSGRAIYAKRWL